MPMNSGFLSIIMSLLDVMSLQEEYVQDEVIEYGSGNLRYFTCFVTHSITVKLSSHAPIAVASPAAGLSLIESCSNMVGKHQSKIAWKTMDILPGRPFPVYLPKLSGKPIHFTKVWSSSISQ